MPSTAKNPIKRPRLDREAWVTSALQVLSAEGIDGVRVEVLASRLGVTKGSFYWHFRNRMELHSAMLDFWRKKVVFGVMDRLRSIDDPMERYRAMMRLPFGKLRPDFDLELAVRLWSRRDPTARAALAEADELRINFIVEVITAVGAPVETARSRAVLIYSYLRMGSALMDEVTLKQCEQLLIAPSP